MYWGLRYQAGVELRKQLDADAYADHQTMTITLPMSLPYPVESNFERVDGEFEYKGEFYKLVKQQLRNDTLYVVCVKDHREKQLVGEMVHFTKLANDLPVSSQSLKLFGRLLKDYTSGYDFELMNYQTGWMIRLSFEEKSFSLFDGQKCFQKFFGRWKGFSFKRVF